MRGMEEQKKKREELNKQKLMKRKSAESALAFDSIEDLTSKKPHIPRKEPLLKKRNPFDSGSTDVMVLPMDVDIKKEELSDDHDYDKRAVNVKPKGSFSSGEVQFNRTISRSMEDLGLIRSRPTTPVAQVNRPKSPHPMRFLPPKSPQPERSQTPKSPRPMRSQTPKSPRPMRSQTPKSPRPMRIQTPKPLQFVRSVTPKPNTVSNFFGLDSGP